MTEKFVTVATFDKTFEAQLAKNLLEAEGIASTLSGEFTADMLPLGQAGGIDQIVLQVQENDAQALWASSPRSPPPNLQTTGRMRRNQAPMSGSVPSAASRSAIVCRSAIPVRRLATAFALPCRGKTH